jgi:peptidoglycan glycosyltransferase
LSRLAEQAEYLKLEIYLEYLSRTERTSHFYSALAQAALFRPTESRKVMKAMAGPELRDNAKAVALITAANDRIQTGKIHYIFDANGEPLAHYDVKLGRTVSEAPGLSFTSFTPSLQHGLRYYTLTIDLRIQKIIARVFAKYSGSMLVLDLEDGGIAAAYSKPTAAPMENPVFERQYEPGSTMKVITLYGYLADEGQSCYPVECRGLINLGDRVFYDRLPHGIIETPQKALAVSCNIAFAKMGLKLGLKKMTGTYELFMFNAPPLTDEFLKFHLGRIDSAADHGYRLANLSVGLNEVSVTTFHSALIPALVAQQGSVYKPHMIKTIKNVLNLGFYNHAAETLETRGLPRLHAEIQKAMIAVVENPSGTGRRARVEFMRTAVKTGTAGEKSAGFDAVMIGFFPAKYPRYAFAFRLQGGGKAEFNAAYLLKSFLTEWRGIGTDD